MLLRRPQARPGRLRESLGRAWPTAPRPDLYGPRTATSWDRCQQFEQIALTHLDSVFHMAVYLCRNRAEAEDPVQETYLRAFRHFDQFTPGTNCRAWLFTILHNTFINRAKREGHYVLEYDGGQLNGAAADSSEVMATIADPEGGVFKQLVGAELVKALEQLPVRFRLAVFLADVQGCSYKEIAQICRVPLGTVMFRLFRGRQRLRKALGAVCQAWGPFLEVSLNDRWTRSGKRLVFHL